MPAKISKMPYRKTHLAIKDFLKNAPESTIIFFRNQDKFVNRLFKKKDYRMVPNTQYFKLYILFFSVKLLEIG